MLKKKGKSKTKKAMPLDMDMDMFYDAQNTVQNLANNDNVNVDNAVEAGPLKTGSNVGPVKMAPLRKVAPVPSNKMAATKSLPAKLETKSVRSPVLSAASSTKSTLSKTKKVVPEQKNWYSIFKAIELKNALIAEEITDLDFYGNCQMTDMVLYMIMAANKTPRFDLSSKMDCGTKCDKVTSLNLGGCYQITDFGLTCAAKVFPNLKSIDLTGCRNVTEAGLYQLLERCSKLETFNIPGTNVTILPQKAAKVEFTFEGFPCISPQYELLKKQGLQIMTAPSYAKPANEDLVKMCVIHGSESKHSFIKYLNKDKDISIKHLAALSQFKVDDRFKANIVECHETICDLFITKRALYVIAVNDGCDVKTTASWIFGLICQIINKVKYAAFTIVGMKSGSAELPLEKIITEVSAMIKTKSTSLRRTLETEFTEVHQNMSKKSIESLYTTIEAQEAVMSSIILSTSLENLTLESMVVDLKKPFSGSDALKPISSAFTKICQLYPEYQEIAAPIYNFAASNSIDNMLKSGLISMEVNSEETQKTVELMSVMGRAVLINLLDGTYGVCLIDWLAKFVSTAFSPPTKNEGRVFVLDDDVPIWSQEDLNGALSKVTDEFQVNNGLGVLQQLGLSVYPSVFIAFKDLPNAPPIPLDQIFPEIPAFGKKTKTFYTVGYQAMFSSPVPVSIIRQLMAYCLKLRRWSMAWKTGFIIQEAVVETLFELKPERGDTSSISLYCHSITEHMGQAAQKIEEMVWNSALQFKIILDYVLKQNNLPNNLKLIMGIGEMSKNKAVDMVVSHRFQPEEIGENKVAHICTSCGIGMKQNSIPWVMKNSLCNTFFVDGSVELVGSVSLTGNTFGFDKSGAGTAYVYSSTFTNLQTTFRMQLLEGSAQKLKIGLGRPMNFKNLKLLSERFYLDIDQQKIIMDKLDLESKTYKEQKSLPLNTLIVCGTEVKICTKEVEGSNQQGEVSFYSNNILLGNFNPPNCLVMPFIENGEGSDVQVLFHPVPDNKQTTEVGLVPGMRLEALDIQNPHLMCVATVEKIQDDGKLLIHFDGWTSRYDYVCEPTSTNIHPIGWMEANKKSQRLNQSLQAPNGYRKAFTWPSYCQEVNAQPVPFEFFSEEQIGLTTFNEYDKVMELISGVTVMRTMSCGSFKNRAKVVEYETIKKCKNASGVFEFFTRHSKLFSILPQNFSIMKLKHPCIGDIMDFTQQNVHILCPGLKMELLHFIDDAGLPLTSYEPFTELQNAAFLQNCFIGLIMQEETLPKNCSKLVPGIENIADQDKCESWFKKLIFMYMCMLQLHSPATNTNVTMSREAMELFNNCVKSKQLENLISEGDRYVKCKGHAGSSMANNSLKEIPMENFNSLYMFMTRLDFQNNQIQKLPDDFFTQFKALEYLNVSKNGIDSLPADLGNLKELTELDISSNRFEKLPDELANLSENLQILRISDNKLNCVPACVFKLTKLEELGAENIGEVKDISGIKNLKELKFLNLGQNLLATIPDELGDLPLEQLDLSGVPWIAQTTYQSYMAFVKTMNANHVTSKIDGNELKEMFKFADKDESSTLTADEVITLNNEMFFPKYARFGTGNLKFEKTGGIPPVLFKLTKLKKLVLHYHGITHIPDDIKNLTNLNEFDLSYNPKMKTLTAELGGLPLKQIHLHECLALNTPPKEVVRRGHMAVMGYLKRLRLGAVPCRRTKLMMVGLGGAGKTSLVQSLMNHSYRAYMDHDEPITDGIDITKWEVEVGGEGGNLTFSVWDFAGQTVYYNTHQFFLSNRAVYLLLWNVRQGYEHAGLDFWLSSIACHAPKAPILVVGTHIDKVEKFRLPEDNLKSRYPQIVGFHYVSSFNGTGVKELSQTILENTLKQKYMGEKIPEAWLTLEKRLIEYREAKAKDILPFKTLEGISASCGIFDRAELVQAVQFLHDLGAVQFFDTDFLRHMIVIYPQWIVDVMACLVTVHQGVVKEGRMNINDLDKIWTKYPNDLHPWLLRLTEEFDLTCPLGDGEISIVPCLLPDTEPQYDWPHADPAKNIRESTALYKFQYLPAGLFNRAQVRLHTYSQGALLWKTGSFMKKNDHIALMIQTDDQELIVKAQGFRPENFLFIVHEMIETLTAESYAGVQYDFFIPCMDCQNRNVKDPSMISHQKVQRALELNVPFLQCEKFFHMLSLQELKDAMPSDKMSEVDSHLRNSVRELIDLTHEKTVSVFFVYSVKDVPDLSQAEKMVHPGTVMEDLRSQDMFKMSYTDKPETSDMEALTLSLKANDVIIFGLSDQFAENEECRKLLLYTKEVLQRPILLLLLGNTKNWQKGELSMPLGDEVFVDMTKKDRYPHKIKELYEAIQKKDESKKKVKEQPPACFISYCWTNSHDAISKGSRNKEGALGWSGGDPRVVKKFLEDKGVDCWLDIERVGGVGLYTSIADGLREAKVVLAFVSDEYVESKNCVMEFRQSLITCRLPVIVVAVGTGYRWEENEVGMMAVGHKCPKVNMQFDNESGYLQILNLVQETLAKTSTNEESKKDVEKQRNIAFQEVMELTQRKFLRHLNNSFISNDLEPFPSLFVVDFISDKERQDYEAKQKESIEKSSAKEKQEGESGEKSQKDDTVEILPDLKTKYCIRLLCEHTEGWHVMPGYIPFPSDLGPEEEQNILDSTASYLTRVYTIIKYSNILLECVTTPEGEIFQQRMEDIGIKSGGDFKQEYLTLRSLVMQQDKNSPESMLQKCHVNGKSVWLCKEHKKATRSKTEQMYDSKFEQDESSIPIPSGDGFVSMEPEIPTTSSMESKVQKKGPVSQNPNTQRKLFRRNISDTNTGLKRQTSQACNVM